MAPPDHNKPLPALRSSTLPAQPVCADNTWFNRKLSSSHQTDKTAIAGRLQPRVFAVASGTVAERSAGMDGFIGPSEPVFRQQLDKIRMDRAKSLFPAGVEVVGKEHHLANDMRVRGSIHLLEIPRYCLASFFVNVSIIEGLAILEQLGR
jgi:hypothetical protein